MYVLFKITKSKYVLILIVNHLIISIKCDFGLIAQS